MKLDEALENIYTSLNDDNKDIDLHIAALKGALPADKQAVTIDPARLPFNNRQGRKVMQAYFKKYGVSVSFKE